MYVYVQLRDRTAGLPSARRALPRLCSWDKDAIMYRIDRWPSISPLPFDWSPLDRCMSRVGPVARFECGTIFYIHT